MDNIKKCSKCGKELSLGCFYKENLKNGNIRYRSECIDCKKAVSFKWQKDNPEKVRANNLRRIRSDPEANRARAAKWYANNPDKAREARARWRKNNPYKARAHYAKWKAANPEKEREYGAKRRANHASEINEYRAKYVADRRAKDYNFRIMRNVQAAVGSAFRKKRYSKGSHTEELLGCSIEYLCQYLESQFVDGMTWNNYGVRGWHIDHIIPLSYFDFSDLGQQKRAWHYTNLRPMWAGDNIRKGNKIIEMQLVLL